MKGQGRLVAGERRPGCHSRRMEVQKAVLPLVMVAYGRAFLM